MPITEPRPHMWQGPTDQRSRDTAIAGHQIVGANNCRFGWAIQDTDFCHREYGLHLSQQCSWHNVAADADHTQPCVVVRAWLDACDRLHNLLHETRHTMKYRTASHSRA